MFAASKSARLACNDGTKGIFALGEVAGSPTTTRNKYTYATCASTACGVAASSSASRYGSAAGNSTRGIFALGSTSGAFPSSLSTTRNKYTYATCSSTASGVGAASYKSGLGAAAGNNTRGIFALGYAGCCLAAVSTRNKYTYACCSSTSSGVGSASSSSYNGAAAGNSTRGIFALGQVKSGCSTNPSATRNKYTYACCTSTSSGVGTASSNSARGAAAGNSTKGIFALGYASSVPGKSDIRNKYTYATCASTACGVAAATYASMDGAAAGNSTRGIFALGGWAGGCYSTFRDKYTYATCASTNSGVGTASSSSGYGTAASWAICVNA